MPEIKMETDRYELEISTGHSLYFRDKLTGDDTYETWDSLGVRSEYYSMLGAMIEGWLSNISMDLLPSHPQQEQAAN